MGHPYWPLFDLEVRTPRLTLRYIDDARHGEVVVTERYRMSREHFLEHVRRDDVDIVGDHDVRELLGLTR